MASNITVDTLTKGSTTLNTDEIVDTNSSQVCKAWVNFNGTGTVAIRDSYNVSSITDSATGEYIMNLTNSLANTNACAVSGVSRSRTTSDNHYGDDLYVLSTSAIKMATRNSASSAADYTDIAITVFSN